MTLKEEILVTNITCDICHMAMLAENQFELHGRTWDVCATCTRDLERILLFLTAIVGLDIPYRRLLSSKNYDQTQDR